MVALAGGTAALSVSLRGCNDHEHARHAPGPDALAAQLGYRPRAWGWLGDGGHDRAGGLVSPTGVGVARTCSQRRRAGRCIAHGRGDGSADQEGD